MMPVRSVVVLVVILASRSEAVCTALSSDCFCFQPARVGVVVTELVDGARSTVRVESATAGVDAGVLLEFPREGGETVGSRWLVLDVERRFIDDAGTVGCSAGYTGAPRVALEAAEAAVMSQTCDQDLQSLGFTAPCNDTRACSSAPLALFPLLTLAWALRRRRPLPCSSH